MFGFHYVITSHSQQQHMMALSGNNLTQVLLEGLCFLFHIGVMYPSREIESYG